jgi:hypothetical protein
MSQSHLACSTQLLYIKFGIPSPPRSSGLVTLSHATRQCPPFTSFLPFHKKPRRILSIAPITHLGTFMAMKRYTGIAESTNRTKAVLPARFRSGAFQPGSRLAILSTHCKRSLSPTSYQKHAAPNSCMEKKPKCTA